jgi:hypothetical protein
MSVEQKIGGAACKLRRLHTDAYDVAFGIYLRKAFPPAVPMADSGRATGVVMGAAIAAAIIFSTILSDIFSMPRYRARSKTHPTKATNSPPTRPSSRRKKFRLNSKMRLQN